MKTVEMSLGDLHSGIIFVCFVLPPFWLRLEEAAYRTHLQVVVHNALRTHG